MFGAKATSKENITDKILLKNDGVISFSGLGVLVNRRINWRAPQMGKNSKKLK